MVALIEDAVALSDDARIVSIGCGTGTVEAELARRGLNIQAIDILPLAVEITRRKGIHAEVADATEWQPDTDFDLIYVDGVAGHLYDPLDHCIRGAARMVSWLKPGGIMLLANDEPAGDQYSAQAESVPGFHWLSMNVIADNLERMDLHVVKAERFNYTRPVSGPRSRAIVLGSVGN
jgi:trans-aconitate methyltransferase